MPFKWRAKAGAVACFRGGLLVVVLSQARLPAWYVEKEDFSEDLYTIGRLSGKSQGRKEVWML
jgi:hypothetical protein